MIQYQILQTNITRTIWQTVRRITNEILGVKGLMQVHSKIKQAATRSAAIGFSFKSDWLRLRLSVLNQSQQREIEICSMKLESGTF